MYYLLRHSPRPRIDLEKSQDPAYRLRQLAKKYNNKYENTRVSNKIQKGGLAPLLVPIIASIAGALVGKVYDTIRSKIKGKGHKMPNHITTKSKRKFLTSIVKYI